MNLRRKIIDAMPTWLLQTLVRFFIAMKNMQRSLKTSGVRQVVLGSDSGELKVLIVGPGEKSIPVSGWGAVELIIANQMNDFERQGINVSLLNSWNFTDWVKAFFWKPDVVLCHYDVLVSRALFFSKLFRSKVVSLTHYAYAQQPERWDSQFSRYVKALAKSDVFVALNQEIAFTFGRMYPTLEIAVIPNGIQLGKIQINGPHKGAICLGKVEPRKRQVEIARSLTGDENVRFVGAIDDPEFKSLSDKQKSLFLGPWNREQVENCLAEYSTLFLLGDGEADALVLYEAQAAGLRILTNELSVGAQPQDCEWIHIVKRDEELAMLNDSANTISTQEDVQKIADYAALHYTSSKSTSVYIELIRSLK